MVESSLSECELQAELHDAAASRTNQRVAGRYVGRRASAAEAGRSRGVIAATPAIRRAVRIGDEGVIEDVKELNAELGAKPFLVLEVLEQGEIHVLVALVA